MPTEPVADWAGPAATRYLCIAAHLDRGFRTRFLNESLKHRHKPMGISYGVDLRPVLSHCLAARRRTIIRDIFLAPIALLLFFAVMSAQEVGDDDLILSALIVAALAGGVVVFLDAWFTRYVVIARDLSPQAFPESSSRYPIPRRHQAVIAERVEQQAANVVIYSGFIPFVGAGSRLGEWSFAVNIAKGKRNQLGVVLEPLPCGVRELYEHVTVKLRALALPRVRLEDQVYVNGRDLRGTPFLPDPFACPSTRLSEADLARLIGQPSDRVRHYRCMRVLGWGGELVLSIFFRFATFGENLFVEASYFLLPPVKDRYHEADAWSSAPSYSELGGLCIRSVLTAPFAMVLAVGTLPEALGGPLRNRAERREVVKRIRKDLTFDYGSDSSARQDAAGEEFHRYFQLLDREMYVKVLERQLFEGIVDFLDSRNIDTSELRERESTVLNNGVIVSQSTIQGQNVVLGNRIKTAFRRARGLSATQQAGGAPRSAAAPAGGR